VTADELYADAPARVVTAAGRVRITDGTTTATAARATLYHREGRGVLTGKAKVVTPQGVLEGAEITVDYTTSAITRIVARGKASLDVENGLVSAAQVTIVPETDAVTAQGEVTFFTPPDLIATGARLVYRRTRGDVVLEGRARVQNRDGFVQCERIEAFGRWERVKATGGVHAVLRDIEVRSVAAEVFMGERKAVFGGEVKLTQPGRLLVTEKLTVWYAAGRFVAEGQTRARIETTP
jgi:lipopolysaccharide export system protein LptA